MVVSAGWRITEEQRCVAQRVHVFDDKLVCQQYTITLSPHSALAYTQLLTHGHIDILVGSGADSDTSPSAGHYAACSNRSLSHRTAPSDYRGSSDIDKRSMFLAEGLGEGGPSFLQGALARVGVLGKA